MTSVGRSPSGAVADGSEDVGVLDQLEPGGIVASLLELLGRRRGDAPVGDRRSEDGNVGGKGRPHGLEHLGGSLHLDRLHPGGQGPRHRARHKGNPGAEPKGLCGDRRPLLAGRPVGNVAHRIDGLVRGAARHQHVPAGQGTVRGPLGRRNPEQALDRLDQLRHLGHPAGTGLAPFRHLAGLGPYEMDAVGLQQRHVAARGGREPHARVHRRRHQHRPVGGEQQRRGEVVGMPAGHPGDEVGGGRRHHDQVGVAREPDVADLALGVEVEQLGEHRLVAERPHRQRRDELLRGPGHHGQHLDRQPLAQAADQLQALVGRDAAADDENDAFLLRAVSHRTASAVARGLQALARAASLARVLAHVGAHLVGGLERDAVALAQVGDQMSVIDRRETELRRSRAGPGEEALDLGQQGLGGAAHAVDMMGNCPFVNGLHRRRAATARPSRSKAAESGSAAASGPAVTTLASGLRRPSSATE